MPSVCRFQCTYHEQFLPAVVKLCPIIPVYIIGHGIVYEERTKHEEQRRKVRNVSSKTNAKTPEACEKPRLVSKGETHAERREAC